MKVKLFDIFTLGLALFAMFFGAGNVIFPPFLGMQTSPNWAVAVVAYLLVDIVIAVFAIIVMAKNDEGLLGTLQRIGKVPSRIVGTSVILCMGPLICIPRCAAVAYELLIMPVFGFPNNGIEQIIFSLIFFVITWLLIVRPKRIVDVVGNFLTPLLLAALALLIIKGIIVPDSNELVEPLQPNAVGVGIIAGYQSMDLFGSLSFGTVMITSAFIKGYKAPNQRVKVLSYSSILCLILLFITSIGMAFLGSKYSAEFSSITSQAVLVSAIAGKLFSFGPVLIGILASLACLTTSIGLTSGSAVFFKDLLTETKIRKEKNNKEFQKLYGILCTVVCVVSFIISNLGLETIIQWTSPILSLIFPVAVVVVLLSWFNMQIKSDRVFQLSALFAFISNFFVVINEWFFMPFVEFIPLAEMQLGWVLPVIFGIILGFIVGRKGDDRKKLKIYQNQMMERKNKKGKNESKN